jgi:SpoVK/Ycf46/Vps4 family AAA+-type ATPase
LIPIQSSASIPVQALSFPQPIEEGIGNILRVSEKPRGINKFLFYGEPGTGKTEAVKYIAHESKRSLYSVAMAQLVDSLLGETAKNIGKVFSEINGVKHPEKIIVLFDEIDALALTRLDSNDVREMGRATTALLRGLDSLNENVLLFATTNLHSALDKALTRRFDYSLSFDQYSNEDLEEVAVSLFSEFLITYPYIQSDKRLFRKVLRLFPALPNPGDMKNMIKTAIAFSDSDNGFDYLRRLYRSATGTDPNDVIKMKAQGFTVREIERLSSIPKSTVSRKINSCSADGTLLEETER